MALHILDPETERLAKELAQRSGRPIGQAVADALRQALARSLTDGSEPVSLPAAPSGAMVDRPGTSDEDATWGFLVSEPGVGVTIIDEDDRLIFVNETNARFYLDRGAEGLAGRTLDEIGFPPEAIKDSHRVIDLLKRRGGPVGLRNLWKGRQLLETTWRIDWPGKSGDHFLIITRHISGELPFHGPDVPVVQADVIELGALNVLTARELEVLSLIGQGLSTQQIALLLYRSPRTIEAHRRSIRNKLDEGDRVKLALAAHAAGLTLADADRRRTTSPS